MLAGYQIHSSTLCLGRFNNVPVFIACNRLHEFHKSLNRTLKAFAFQICARNWHKPDISLCLTYVSKLCTEKYRERRGKKNARWSFALAVQRAFRLIVLQNQIFISSCDCSLNTNSSAWMLRPRFTTLYVMSKCSNCAISAIAGSIARFLA